MTFLILAVFSVNCDQATIYRDESSMSYQNFEPLSAFYSGVNDGSGDRSPVILIPGLEASQVEAKITDKKETRHFFCSKNSDWFLIWLNPEEFIPQIIDCFMDNFKLIYDHKLRRTHNAQGIDIRVPGFGETHSVEYLSNLEIGPRKLNCPVSCLAFDTLIQSRFFSVIFP